MGGGAWPFLVGGAICLVNSVNERDLSLLNSYVEVCDALRCSGPHARYTDVFNESIALADRPGKRESSARVDFPFVHTARRSYRLNGPVKCSDCGDVGGSLPATLLCNAWLPSSKTQTPAQHASRNLKLLTMSL
ncbi:hypothetical protein VNO77_49730 [Canavalia gladiata]|uniref:Uncharacterized protein n=1 Tax=Canavalia gladiata TaxID=3824 RepID=A0AAN9PFK0_CANGL